MAGALSALSPMEVALTTVALVGFVPVAVQYRDRSKWFAAGYCLLVVAALSTNLEGLFLGDVLNVAEHGLGLMGAGLAFFAAAYVHRQADVRPDEAGASEVTDDG